MRFRLLVFSILASCMAVSAQTPPKLVFAHYMGNNKDYASNADSTHETQIAGYEREIQQAQAIGIDGWMLNAGSWIGEGSSFYYYPINFSEIFEAAVRLNSGFKLIVNTDLSGSLTTADVEDMLRRFINDPRYGAVYYKYNGQPVWTTFAGSSNHTTAFFQGIVSDLSTGANPSTDVCSGCVAEVSGTPSNAAISVFFMPAFFWGGSLPSLATIQSNYATWASTINGFFYWGIDGAAGLPNGPNQIPVSENYATTIHGGGKPYMAPLNPEMWAGKDTASNIFYEYAGYEGLRNEWNDIINVSHPDFVGIITWNDFDETHYISPIDDPNKYFPASFLTSLGIPNGTLGYYHTHIGFWSIMKYFIQWYKTGVQPPITQDSIYWAYRNQSMSVFASPNTPFAQTSSNVGPVADSVYVTANLTAPATLTVTQGATVATLSMPAGSSDASTPLVVGTTPSFKLDRGTTHVIPSVSGADAIFSGAPTYAGVQHNDYINSTGSASTGHTYMTVFPVAENPLSDGGNWLAGSVDGQPNIQVAVSTGANPPQKIAYGSSFTANPPPYNDSIAALNPAMVGTWGPNQQACGTVYVNPAFNRTTSNHYEVEIHLNQTIASGNDTGYEFNYSVNMAPSTVYAGITRWDIGGPVGISSLVFPSPLNNGDQLCATRSGASLTMTVIKAGGGASSIIATASDSTYMGGTPGIGHYNNGGVLADDAMYGFSAFTANDGTGAPTPALSNFNAPGVGDECYAAVTTGTTVSCTITNQPSANDVVIAMVQTFPPPMTVSVSDGTNTLLLPAGVGSGGCSSTFASNSGANCLPFLIEPNGSGGKTFTATVTGGTCTACSITVDRFHVTSGVPILDVAVGGSGTGTVTTPTITPSQSGELLFGGCSDQHTCSSITGNWTQESHGIGTFEENAEYQLAASSAQPVGFLGTAGGNYDSSAIAFKISSGPPPPPGGGSNTYSTTFPNTETPLSDSGKWVQGGAVGLDWGNINTVPGKATGSLVSNPPPYNDNNAALTGNWGATQQGCGVVFIDPSLARDSHNYELEIHLNTTIIAHSDTGYEFNYSLHTVAGGQPRYAGITRWDGAINVFHGLTEVFGAPLVPQLNTGDTLCAYSAGGVLTFTVNGATIVTFNDSTYTAGAPGIGTYNHGGASSDNALFGFSSFTATGANQNGGGSTAASCNNTTAQPDVQNAVNLAAAGTTVNVPAGSCTWTAPVNIKPAITLSGAGAGITNITSGLSGSQSHLITFVAPSAGVLRINGFTFTGLDYNHRGPQCTMPTGVAGYSYGATYRIDHNTFNANGTGGGGNNPAGLIDNFSCAGLIDHNTFTTPDSSEDIHNNGDGSIGFNGNGWTDAVVPGGPNMLFVEDNTFTDNSGSGNFQGNSSIESYNGSRLVFRHNTLNSSQVDEHGTAGFIGVRWYEIYNNSFVTSSTLQDKYMDLRAGTGTVYNNTTSGGFGSPNITLREEDTGTWPLAYQIGSGVNGGVNAPSHPTCAALNNAPLYLWNNPGMPISIPASSASIVVSGRDYFNLGSAPTTLTMEEAPSDTCSTTYTYTPFTYPHPLQAGGGGGGGGVTSFITSTFPRTLRNNFTGVVGMSFTVGNQALVVSQLGRFCIGGNTQTHTVKFVLTSTGIDVPGSAVSIPMTGCTDHTFVYGSITPITLSANTMYYEVTSETSGGDQFYDYTNTNVTTTNVATETGSIFGPPNYTAPGVNVANNSYGPIDFKYAAAAPVSISTTSLPSGTVSVAYDATLTGTGGTPPYTWSASGLAPGLSISTTGAITGTPTTAGNYSETITVTDSVSETSSTTFNVNITGFIITVTPGTLRNNYTGVVGMAIQTGPSSLLVTSLGRYVSGAAANSHTVKIIQANGVDLPGGSASVNVLGGVQGTFVYKALSSGVTLSPNTTYYVVTTETSGGDQWYDNNTTVTTTTAASVTSAVYGTAAPYIISSTAGHTYGPVDIVYSAIATLAITTSTLPNGVSGTVYTTSTLAATGGVPPYTWSWTGNAPGLSLSSGGVITGTPTTPGTYSEAVTVTDSVSGTATRTFVVTILPAPGASGTMGPIIE